MAGADVPGAAATQTAGVDSKAWSSVLAQAKDQSLNWYMYGGDEVLNTFVTGYVTDALRKQA